MADYINIVREVKDLNVNESSDIQELIENYGLEIPADCIFNNSDNQGGNLALMLWCSNNKASKNFEYILLYIH